MGTYDIHAAPTTVQEIRPAELIDLGFLFRVLRKEGHVIIHCTVLEITMMIIRNPISRYQLLIIIIYHK